MPTSRPPAALVLALLLASAAALPAAEPAPEPVAEPVPEPAPDPAAELRAAELAFAATVAARDREAFAAFLDEQAVFIGDMVLRGREEILTGWAVFFAEDGPRLDWRPEIVEVRGDGLGLSRGPYTLAGTSADGTEVTNSGIFTSIWRRQADGGWKVLFDAGCPPCAAGSP